MKISDLSTGKLVSLIHSRLERGLNPTRKQALNLYYRGKNEVVSQDEEVWEAICIFLGYDFSGPYSRILEGV